MLVGNAFPTLAKGTLLPAVSIIDFSMFVEELVRQAYKREIPRTFIHSKQITLHRAKRQAVQTDKLGMIHTDASLKSVNKGSHAA